MSEKNVAIYLNDHLAGSAAALRLLDRMVRVVEDDEVVRALERLRDAIREDRATLEAFRDGLGLSGGPLREAGAVAGQVLSNLKLRLEASKHGELQLLHALDSLSLGVEGKKALCTALEAGRAVRPELGRLDVESLERRAEAQLAELRRLRVEAARRAFAPGEDA